MTVTPGDREAPRKRNREVTRAALLAAARVRFAREGYSGTNVRVIAQDVGVDASLVFRYFGSKRALFDEASAENALAAEAVLDGPAEQLPSRLLATILEYDWPESAGEHPFVAMLRSANDDAIRAELSDQLCKTYTDSISRQVRGEDADLRAALFSAWLLGISVLRSVVRDDTLSRATMASVAPHFERVVEALLGEAKAGPAGATPAPGPEQPD
ncbi:TetR family transcriptional regulator [Streptomyces sp. NPDC102451]|uniref:TetR/AcrR family transcriptional regulator n=1 Tax=Streptomyces sp. NPDC102451 TaxID=3366177 RepID=UPI00382C9E06